MFPGKKLVRNTALAAAVSAALAPVAMASLTIDVQVAGGGKSAVVSAAGEQVQLEVFAIVTGTSASGADDGLQLAQGSFLSTGDLQGSLAATEAAPFNGVGSAGGASGSRHGACRSWIRAVRSASGGSGTEARTNA